MPAAERFTNQSALPIGGDRILYGADYNPEQWSRDVWLEDVRLMQKAGVNMVSLGIWSWARLEPAPGQFDFEWFDDVVGILTEAGITIDLATPTAAPPAWFYRAHPEAKLVEKDGTVRHGGSRGICCPHSLAYAHACERLIDALASHVEGNPNIVMWHVHNEFGAPGGDCHCEHTQTVFRDWLREQYGSLDELNRAWGTDFWGQVYFDWDEITTPLHSGAAVNPTCQLDYARFTSDSLLERYKAERDVIRRHFPNTPVTTNFMATNCPANDYWSWVKEIDVVSTDYYLEANNPEAYIWLAMESDLTRSLAGGKPWVLMEHSVSAVSWQPHNWAKMPGEENRNALSHLGRGADGILAFQWRQSMRGAEKFHSAMVPHAGENTRVFREVCELGEDLMRLSNLRGSTLTASVAILWDWNSFWAQDLTWRPSEHMQHREQIRRVYEWLFKRGTTVDFVHPEGDLAKYSTVIAPATYLLSHDGAANIRSFVEGGGTFLALPFFSVVDEEECVYQGGAPGELRDVLGLTVEEIRPIRLGELVPLSAVGGAAANGKTPQAFLWSEHLRLDGAEPLWEAHAGPTPASQFGPAITRNVFGKGTAIYLSVVLSPEDLASTLEPLLNLPVEADLLGLEVKPNTLEVVRRTSSEDSMRSWLFVINHGGEIWAQVAGKNVLTGTQLSHDEATIIPAGGTLIVEVDETRSGHGAGVPYRVPITGN